MATVLGKRKARTAKADAPAISPEEAQEMLRRHFEAQFQPLDIGGVSAADPKDVDGFDDDRSEESNAEEDEDDDDDEGEEGEGSDADDDNDEWGGLSDSDAKTPAAPQIEVVEHVSVPNPASARAADPALRRETKAYLSSRVPTASALAAAAASAAPAKGKGKGGGAEGEDETSTALLRNDLALQRLLTESHLFTAGPLDGGGGSTPQHAGRNRHLATDLRLAALGSKDSIYKQAKMPMAHRKGIIAAAETRDARRRREARENGIVLEKPTAGVHEGWTGLKNAHKKAKGHRGTGAGGSRMRDAAVDAPAVGKLRNGMLQLSKKDVQSIQGSDGGGRRGAAGGGKRRRR